MSRGGFIETLYFWSIVELQFNYYYMFEELIGENGRNDSPELVECMRSAVQKMLANKTSSAKPGILLGKIQSGKTRAFIGIMALAFDSGYDVAIILTKGTKALLQQTVHRMQKDFAPFIEDDKVEVFDVMHMPDNLTGFVRNKKLVIVVKKEVHNMKRIQDKLVNVYPDLMQKKILIIDDEADYASISFRKHAEAVEVGRISSQIDEIRNIVKEVDYLQVTATPYSLYLQPTTEESDMRFLPKRPSFTQLVPVHSGYVGGKFYFEDIEDDNSIAQNVYVPVTNEERDVLKQRDARKFKIEDALESEKIKILRNAIVNFIVGSVIRRLQQEATGQKNTKYAFVAHSEIGRKSHEWQAEIIQALLDQLTDSAKNKNPILNVLLKEAYQNLSKSIIKIPSLILPSLEEVLEQSNIALIKEYIFLVIVNSDKDVEELLDADGQLKLRNPMNIFVGGQILDRGVTINNLIGFYYGRSPKKFQQDTVLQHSRMYGARPKDDLAVTRFYTTRDIFEVMKKIHLFDAALRESFEKGDQQHGIYFIRKDITGRLVPCSPNKLLLSSLATLRPYRRMLPVGFQTGYKTNIGNIINDIDTLVDSWFQKDGDIKPVLVELQMVLKLTNLIEKTLELNNEYPWSWKTFNAVLEHLSKNAPGEGRDKVWLIVRRDRNISRERESRFSNIPENETDSKLAKATAENTPCLMLLRQNGHKKEGWRDTPFWWPILINPANTATTVFAENTITD